MEVDKTKEGLDGEVAGIAGPGGQKATDVGGTTTTLPDGTKIDVYPGRKSKDFAKPRFKVTQSGRDRAYVGGTLTGKKAKSEAEAEPEDETENNNDQNENDGSDSEDSDPI